jgi:UDP-glucose 4-epimerase
MRYLVIGGAGFIGSHLVEVIAARDHEVQVLDAEFEYDQQGQPNMPVGVKCYPCRAETECLREAMLGCDAVFHLAAIPSLVRSFHRPLEAHQNNAGTVVHALSLAAELNVPRFVFASSWTVYGRQNESPLVECMWPRPLSPYALSKWMGEEWCRLYARLYPNLSTLCLRLFNVYGPRSRGDVVTAFVERTRAGQSLQVQGDGSAIRDFVHVNDVVRAFLKADEFLKDRPGFWGVVNVGSGVATSILMLAHLMQHPTSVKFTEASLGPALCVDGIAHTQKARSLLGWQAGVSLLQGIQEMLREETV